VYPGGVCTGGITGGGAVMVGANNCLPQLRQKPSPGAAMAPHCGQTVAFNVGSLIFEFLDSLCCRGLARSNLLQVGINYGEDASI
jgi:hypothetical protein